MSILGGDGSITLTTKIDESGLKTGFSSMKNSVSKMTGGMTSSLAKLGGTIATILSVRALLNFSNEASKMASNVEASAQRIIDIYGSASQAVGDFIDSNSRALGMSRASATEAAAVYGNLLSVWADQQTNAELTQHYLNMTAVVASRTGRTMEDVLERIRSGLLGNTEAVEDLGIFVNIKTIEMTEAFRSVANGAKWDSLTASQQAQVRTLAILEQATNKYGSTVANTTAFTRLQYQAAFEDFKATWGQVVNIILMPILRIMTTIFSLLTAGLQAIAGLSGKTIKTPKISAGGGGGGGGGGSAPSSGGGGGGGGGSGKSAEEEAIENEIKAIQKKIKELQKESAAEKQLGDEIDALQKKLKQLRKESPEEEAASAEAKAIQKSIKALQKENKQIQKNAKEKEKAAKKELASFDQIEILNFDQQSEEDKLLEANQDEIEALQEKLELVNENKDALREARQLEIDAIEDTLDAKRDSLDAIREAESDEIDRLQEQLELLRERQQALQEAKSAGGAGGGGGFGGGGVGGFGFGDLGEPSADEYTEKLALIGMVTGWALVGLGIILMFSGHVLIGAAMAAAGFLVAAGAAEGGSTIKDEEVKQKLINIATITGVALIGLGILLLFTPFWTVGLGMIAAGATAIYSALALGDFSEDVVAKVTKILQITGFVLFVLGTILLFVPVASGVGIAMLAAGAALLFTEAVINAEKVKTWIEENMTELLVHIAKWVLIIGVMLCFAPGMLGWGIAAIAAGVGILTIAATNADWSELKNQIQAFFKDNWKAIAAVSFALVVLGIILCFAHQWLWGIGLIAAGLVGLYSSIAPNWNEIKSKIAEFFKDNWGAIALVSSVLVILGIILCFAQQWLIGIGLIATGAAGLYSAIVPNWGEIKEKISEFFKDNWDTIAAVSFALVVLGIILCIAQLWLVGIGLIAIGLAGMYAAIVPNWDEVKNAIQNFFRENSAFFVGVGIALVVLGIVLLFTGVGIPLGLGLLVAGGASLAAAIAPNWTYIVDKVKETWGKVQAYWKQNIAKYFTSEWWGNLAKKAVNGLIKWFITGLNKLIGKVNSLGFDLPEALGGGHVGFKIATLTIPQLAKGAVLPANKPFLAMVGDQKHGTNIEAPLDTIVEAMNIALSHNGGSGGGNTEVILQIDGREFGRAVVEQGNKENRRIGTRLVLV